MKLLVQISKYRNLFIGISSFAVTIVLGQLILHTARSDHWDTALWLWFFCGLILIGAILYEQFPAEKISAYNNFQTSFVVVNIYQAAICLIVFSGFLLRLWGADFGLPSHFHPDEARKARIVKHIVEMGDLNPHYFSHPSFLLYATAAICALDHELRGTPIQTDVATYYGRLVSVILGSMSLFLIAMLARELYGKYAGLLAALFLSFNPLHIVCSRYMKEDVSMLFFVLLVAVLSVRFAKSGRLKMLYSASFFAGVAASAKYTGMLSIAFVGLAYITFFIKQRNFDEAPCRTLSRSAPTPGNNILLASLLLIPLLALCGFIIVTPYSVLDCSTFLKQFLEEGRHIGGGHNFAVTASSQFWMFHFRESLWKSLTPITSLVGICALGFILRRAKWADIFLVSAVLLFYLPAEWVNAKPEPQPERYILPCIPFISVAVATFTQSMLTHRTAIFSRLVILLAFIIPAAFSFWHAYLINNDTRIQSARWIEANVPKHSRVLIDWSFYAPPISRVNYDVIELKRKKGFYKHISSEALRSLKADYVVLSSFTYQRYWKHREGEGRKQLFEKLWRETPPVKTFSSRVQFGFHNPTIRILKLS